MRKHKVVYIHTFTVDKKNRVVICKLGCDASFWTHPAVDNIKPDFYNKTFPDVDFGRFSVTAKARCNPEDDFDERVGKTLAYGRAKVKMYRKVGRIFKLCSNEFERLSAECAKSWMKYMSRAAAEHITVTRACHGK